MNFNDFSLLEKKSDVVGNEMFNLMKELFPICRSITGNGVRQTLSIIQKIIPLEIHEIPSETKVFDWDIPKEWNIRDAYILDPNGEKIIDFQKSNLHVLNYSVPVNKKISLQELKKHLHTIPEKPDLIPYVTSYYSENWGFCMTHNQFLNLKEGEYHVVIDSTLEKGSLTYGEYFIPGKTDQEILLSCYVCHPSMCNDNLSGVVLLTFLAKYLKNFENFYSIRFLFVPETIGSITWINRNEKNLVNIKHGLVATCLGDSGKFTYKKSREGNNEIDVTVVATLQNAKLNYNVVDFFPWGSDERQFCSPGFNLPVGSLIRSMYGKSEFSEYHTSADNLDFMNKNSLSESFSIYFRIIYELEKNSNNSNLINEKNPSSKITKKTVSQNDNSEKFLNLNPKCEPQLGKRGIYHQLGGQVDQSEQREMEFAIFWILNLSDGKNSLHDISERSGIPLEQISKVVEILSTTKLLKKIENDP